MMRINGNRFIDEENRSLILRGVNLGGNCKMPYSPKLLTQSTAGLYDHGKLSYVGRPFPLEEADEHFSRLRSWGFTFLRLLVSWEAIEHEGPGIYDEEYLDYIRAIVKKAQEYGFDLFIDPHQDAWGRLCGGDGAPDWTFEVIGLNPPQFSETGAAVLHCFYEPPMPYIWPTNYKKLAAATLFTLFWAGNDFAPQTFVEGIPVQEYFQKHYIDAVKQVAARVCDLPNVVGYDIFNEPCVGYVGWEDLKSNGSPRMEDFIGDMPTPFQSMLLGDGYQQEVEVWESKVEGPLQIGRRLINEKRIRAWADGKECIWKTNGVWEVDSNGIPCLLRPNHFTHIGPRRVDFFRDYLIPFTKRYAKEIREVHKDAFIFFEGGIWKQATNLSINEITNMVHAPHWYDGLLLYLREFDPEMTIDYATGKRIIGREPVRRFFIDQLGDIQRMTEARMGQIPNLIGEFGVPFDLDKKAAYKTEDFSSQIDAMDCYYSGLEANLLSSTLWNYASDNNNEWGDNWNEEDLSIFSRDQQTDPKDINSGGRAVEAFVRPYAHRISGSPLQMSFDISSREFLFEFKHDPEISAPTEIFVPAFQYPNGFIVTLSDGSYEMGTDKQWLKYWPDLEKEKHQIKIQPKNSTCKG